MFTNGKRCRRRASEKFDGWCEKHGPIMNAEIEKANRALKGQARLDDEMDP
jgi:hypothetical protein